MEERVRDVLVRLDADLRFADGLAADEAATRSRAAVTRLNSASARLLAALAALLAVPPTALAALTTCSAASLAELLSCDSLRFATLRFRVAAAFFAVACRWTFVWGAIGLLLSLSSHRERRSIAWRFERDSGIPRTHDRSRRAAPLGDVSPQRPPKTSHVRIRTSLSGWRRFCSPTCGEHGSTLDADPALDWGRRDLVSCEEEHRPFRGGGHWASAFVHRDKEPRTREAAVAQLEQLAEDAG